LLFRPVRLCIVLGLSQTITHSTTDYLRPTSHTNTDAHTTHTHTYNTNTSQTRTDNVDEHGQLQQALAVIAGIRKGSSKRQKAVTIENTRRERMEEEGRWTDFETLREAVTKGLDKFGALKKKAKKAGGLTRTDYSYVVGFSLLTAYVNVSCVLCVFVCCVFVCFVFVCLCVV
jgi:hypothetical protein